MSVEYRYHGRCDACGVEHALSRTSEAEAAAQALMTRFREQGPPTHEGKMYGVLLGLVGAGEFCELYAFSGMLDGGAEVDGWAPPATESPGLAALERRTLRRLNEISERIGALDASTSTERQNALHQDHDLRIDVLKAQHHTRREARARDRAGLGTGEFDARTRLDEESRQDGREMRAVKSERLKALAPIEALRRIETDEIAALKAERKTISKSLQQAMHQAYELTNFAGKTEALSRVFGSDAIPTGTGECCAPKLLQWAARRGIRPMGLAEFWWGADDAGLREAGEFYGACEERCHPIMGHLLCGIDRAQPTFVPPDMADVRLEIIHVDEHLVVVNKPAGLLSTPGRTAVAQDCVQRRLEERFGVALMVHRLDMDTSGLMVVALTPETHRGLGRQFEERTVSKIYSALVEGAVDSDSGEIRLAFRLDPDDRPRQIYDPVDGVLGVTHYTVVERRDGCTRLDLRPETGRTHQLRVHCAHRLGLDRPIVGDRLYGEVGRQSRLHLHARRLGFRHPDTGDPLSFDCPTPF